MKFQKPKRKIDRVFIHCSASDNPKTDNAAAIKRYHTGKPPNGRGWSDIGYHYYIRKDGTVEAGRPISKVPAAQKGHNTGTIAICLGGLEKDAFTLAQFKSLYSLCADINDVYGGKVTFHGHREVQPLKTCPVFDYKTVLGLSNAGYMGASAPRMPMSDATRTAPPKSKSPTHKPLSRSKTMWSGGVLSGILTGLGTWFTTLAETNPMMAYVVLGVAIFGIGLATIIMWERIKKFRRGE